MCGGQEEGQWHTDSIRHHYTPFKRFHWWHDERGNYNKCLQSLTILFKGTAAGFYHTLTDCCSFLVQLWGQLLFSLVFRYPNDLWLWAAELFLPYKQIASVADIKFTSLYLYQTLFSSCQNDHMWFCNVADPSTWEPSGRLNSQTQSEDMLRESAMRSFVWAFLH